MGHPRTGAYQHGEHKRRVEAQYDRGCAMCRQSDWQGPSGIPRYTRITERLNDEQKPLPRNTRAFINPKTLFHRFTERHRPAQSAHASQQLLTPTQELVIISWLFHLALRGEPANKRKIRQFATKLAGRRPGQNWIYGFLRRHPEIRLAKVANLDPKRAQAFNPAVVAFHFDLLKEVLDEHGVPWENVYNMDEKGCQRGGGKGTSSEKYFVPRGKLQQYRASSGNLELVTVLECVCADGTGLQPTFVFKGSQYEENWALVHDDICCGLSENGWTDNVIGMQWLKESFIPQAQARNKSGKPILLILDGHGSHETIEMLEYAYAHNVLLYSLPPHTTHKLQPLDVGVFGPFSRNWTEHCNAYIDLHNTEIPRAEFVREYMKVRDASFTEDLVRHAFKESGIAPLDPSVFTPDDFGPSLLSSTTARTVPPEYSTDRPPAATIPSAESPALHVPDVEPFEPLVLLIDEDGEDGEDEVEEMGAVTGDDPDHDVGAPTPPPIIPPISAQSLTPSTAASSASFPPIPPARFYAPISPLSARPKRIPDSPTRNLARPVHRRHPLGPLPSVSHPARHANIVHDDEAHAAATEEPVRILIPSADDRIAAMQRELAAKEAELAATKAKLQYAEAHSVIAEVQLERATEKLNARGKGKGKGKGKGRKTKGGNARLLTSREIRRSTAADRAEADAKAEEKRSKEIALKHKERELRDRRDDRRRRGVPFVGHLNSFNKDEVRDIADALDLPETGSKDELLAAIRAEFTQKPEMWEADRFCQLYDPHLPYFDQRKRNVAEIKKRDRRQQKEAQERQRETDENARPLLDCAASATHRSPPPEPTTSSHLVGPAPRSPSLPPLPSSRSPTPILGHQSPVPLGPTHITLPTPFPPPTSPSFDFTFSEPFPPSFPTSSTNPPTHNSHLAYPYPDFSSHNPFNFVFDEPFTIDAPQPPTDSAHSSLDHNFILNSFGSHNTHPFGTYYPYSRQ